MLDDETVVDGAPQDTVERSVVRAAPGPVQDLVGQVPKTGGEAKAEQLALQNFTGDRVDVNLVRLRCVLYENLPYSAPAHLLQSGVERSAAMDFLGRRNGLAQCDPGVFQSCQLRLVFGIKG